MERCLYYDSPDVKEWQTQVKEIMEKDGKYHVVLEESAFYPGGGGQPSDRGMIDGIPVEDVYEKDGRIYHVLTAKPEHAAVLCKLDAGRRFDLMQQHTGQHLLSSVLYNDYLCKTSSLHMGETEVSIDVSLPDMPAQMIREVEDKANDFIYKDLPVKTHVVTPGEVGRFKLRKVPPSSGTIRVVEIDAIDFSPCCGTHVARTGQIGIIKIVKTEKRGNETRVHFKCGRRALNDYQFEYDIISELSKRYRTEEDEILARVDAQSEQLKNTMKELSDLKGKILRIEAKDMAVSATSKVIQRSFEDKRFDELNALSQYILENGNFIVILSSIPDKRLLFAHNGSFDINCGKVLKEHLPEFNGKGGGKPQWANGGFGSLEDMKRFESFLKEFVSKI